MARSLIRALAGSWYVLAFLSLFGMGAWYGFFEPPFLTYRNLPFPVVREPRPGEAVLLTVWRCNADDHERSYAISHVLVRESDEERTILPPGLVPIRPGCTIETSAANVIPAGTLPGRYYVEGHAEAHGTVRRHDVYWRSAAFTVHERNP
jgi:hypothetical protein